jgi:hypothetical protein
MSRESFFLKKIGVKKMKKDLEYYQSKCKETESLCIEGRKVFKLNYGRTQKIFLGHLEDDSIKSNWLKPIGHRVKSNAFNGNHYGKKRSKIKKYLSSEYQYYHWIKFCKELNGNTSDIYYDLVGGCSFKIDHILELGEIRKISGGVFLSFIGDHKLEIRILRESGSKILYKTVYKYELSR